MTRLGPLFAVLLLTACSTSDPDDGEGATGGTGGGGPCNQIVNSAPDVDEVNVAEDLPVDAMGGAMAPGTYRLSSHATYTGLGGLAGPSGNRRKQTVVVADTGSGSYTMESVLSRNGAADERVSFAFALTGTLASTDITCPSHTHFADFQYTAMPTGFTVYDNVDSQVTVYALAP